MLCPVCIAAAAAAAACGDGDGHVGVTGDDGGSGGVRGGRGGSKGAAQPTPHDRLECEALLGLSALQRDQPGLAGSLLGGSTIYLRFVTDYCR